MSQTSKFLSVSVILLLSLNPSTFAAKRDVFFLGEDTYFIKTDIVKSGESRSEFVEFSACKLIDRSNGTAECKSVAMVNKKEFVSMRACMSAQTGLVGATLGAGIGLLTLPPASVGFILFSSGTVGTLTAGIDNSNFVLYTYRDVVYSSKVENDSDHFAKQHVSYDSFVISLIESMEKSFFDCDVGGNSFFMMNTKEPTKIKIPAHQLKVLNSVDGMKWKK